MSSDFLEDVEDDKGTVVLLTMSAGGLAELTIMEPDKDAFNFSKDGSLASLRLIPNEAGWGNATKIADALKAWVEHTKSVKGIT